MRIGRLITIMILAATAALAQVPTTHDIESARGPSPSASSEWASLPLVVQPERYDRTMVAPDTLSAVIDTLNDPTHVRAYQAALSEIRETLVKQRVAALIMIYKQQIGRAHV